MRCICVKMFFDIILYMKSNQSIDIYIMYGECERRVGRKTLDQQNYVNKLNIIIENMIEYKNDNDTCDYKVVHVKRCQKYIKKYLMYLSKLNLPSNQ